MYTILMEVRYQTKPGMRAAFMEEVEPYRALSRAEDGNESYDYFINPTDENDLLLIEKWRDEEILQKHFTLDHFKKIGEVKAKYVEKTTITKHYVEIK